MTWTPENIIGLNVIHKDYKNDKNNCGYIIDETGVKYWNGGNKTNKERHAQYEIQSMIMYLNKCTWIPLEQVRSEVINNYQIF